MQNMFVNLVLAAVLMVGTLLVIEMMTKKNA